MGSVPPSRSVHRAGTVSAAGGWGGYDCGGKKKKELRLVGWLTGSYKLYSRWDGGYYNICSG